MAPALAVIDMQKWMFRDPRDAACLPQLVQQVNEMAALFAQRGHAVFDVRTVWTLNPDTWTLRCRKSNEPKLIEGTQDAEAVPGLAMPKTAERLHKLRNSAFVMTDFDQRLRAIGTDRLFLTGCFDEACIGFTAIDAYERNIEPVIVADAVVESDPDLARSMRKLTQMVGDIHRVRFEEAARLIREA